MQSQINEHLARALTEDRTRSARGAEHRHPPPGRMRIRAALVLVALADRLDHEHARRAAGTRWSANAR